MLGRVFAHYGGRRSLPMTPLALMGPAPRATLGSMAIALDTLAYAKRLREAGFSEQQAEGQAQALAAAMTDSLATKQDLHELDVHIRARFEQVAARFEYLERHFDTRLVELERRFEARVGGQLADLECRMTIRLGGIMVAGIGVMSALVKLL